VTNALRLGQFYNRESKKLIKNKEKQVKNMNITVKIEGMMCPHCEARVKTAISGVVGVIKAEVSHTDGEARIEITEQGVIAAVKSAVESAGYPVTEIK
jgi:Cu2+-exporting ATPase